MRTGIARRPLARADETPARFGPAPEIALLSSIAHELRTPLSALSASAEMLQVAAPGEQPQFAAIIQRQAHRLTGIVDGLLEVFRASNGALQRVSEAVDAGPFLEELCLEQRVAFPQHEFVVEEAPALKTLIPDRVVVGMIVSNLLSNAAKYSPAGSRVRLVWARREGGTAIRICDEGSGVPAELRGRMFGPGERGAADETTGHGLGLFIAKRLCDAIGARIFVGETHQGGGCFTVAFEG